MSAPTGIEERSGDVFLPVGLSRFPRMMTDESAA